MTGKFFNRRFRDASFRPGYMTKSLSLEWEGSFFHCRGR